MRKDFVANVSHELKPQSLRSRFCGNIIRRRSEKSEVEDEFLNIIYKKVNE